MEFSRGCLLVMASCHFVLTWSSPHYHVYYLHFVTMFTTYTLLPCLLLTYCYQVYYLHIVTMFTTYILLPCLLLTYCYHVYYLHIVTMVTTYILLPWLLLTYCYHGYYLHIVTMVTTYILSIVHDRSVVVRDSSIINQGGRVPTNIMILLIYVIMITIHDNIKDNPAIRSHL